MDKRFLAILAGLVIIFGGIFVFNQSSSNGSGSGTKNSSQPTQHIEGKGQKKITLIEYGDYQCPICGIYYQPMKVVAAKFSNDIYFQFRNLPLTSIHQNAFAGARAAEAAGLQNKYWQMHDMLYENQNSWSQSSNVQAVFVTYAQQLGLNTTQFKNDYSSDKVNRAINADLAEFKKTGKDQATPSFFLNGTYIDNSAFADAKTNQPNVEKISKVIQDEIDKQNSSNKQ
jgi:protein-disulfide isomerase